MIHLLSQKHRRRDNYWTFHSIKQGCICMLQSEPELRNMRASERASERGPGQSEANCGSENTDKWRYVPLFLIKSSPWLKKILYFEGLKTPRMKICALFCYKIFTMVEENFEFWVSKNAQVKICVIFLDKIFTMVEENFEFRVSENAKNENMWHFF